MSNRQLQALVGVEFKLCMFDRLCQTVSVTASVRPACVTYTSCILIPFHIQFPVSIAFYAVLCIISGAARVGWIVLYC